MTKHSTEKIKIICVRALQLFFFFFKREIRWFAESAENRAGEVT